MQTIERIRRQPKTRANQGMATLYWVSLASRPLSVTEISHALAVRTDSAKKPFDISRICSNNTLLACCMGLVIIDEETSTVRLVHYSLQEFLQNDNDLEVSPFHIHTGHGLIARTCLTYLRFCQTMTLEMAASCLCHRIYEGTTIRWEVACMCQSEFPLFDYASSEWGNHVREGYDTSIGSLAVEWLTAKETASCPCAIMYMSWVRDNYHSRSCPIGWYDYDPCIYKSTPDSLLVLHCIAYFGEHHIWEEVAAAVDPLELNAKDRYGWTPLTWAAARGHCGVIGILLREAEVDPNSTCKLQRTPLMYALQEKMTNATNTLLSNHRVDPTLGDKFGNTPLHLAVEPREVEVLKLLLQDPRVDPNYKGNDGYTPLALAARYGHTEAVKLLLGNPRVDPNHENKVGYTPLALAARCGHAEAVKLLLGNPRVDPNHEGRVGYTPFPLAARCGHAEAVKVFLGNPRMDPNHEGSNGYALLALSASHGHAEAAKLLLGDPRVDPNHEDRDGYAPLALAARRGHAEAVKLLLGNPRVHPNHEDRDGYTPLALAARCGHAEAVKLLLGNPRVDPNHESRDSYTPLALVAKSGHAKAVKVLLGDPRVDPNPIHSAGDTPLLISIKEYLHGSYYSCHVIEAFLTHPRLDRNFRDLGGRTALSYVVAGDSRVYRCGLWSFPGPDGIDLAVVKSLLEGPRGADPNIPDNQGKTALDWALSVDLKNSDECRELLRKYMPTLQTGDAVNTINKRKTPPQGDSAPAKYPKLE